MISKFIYSILFLLLINFEVNACDCPLSLLSMNECNKYELIFKGKIKSVVDSKSKFGEAIFEVEELYKGNSEKTFKVLFDSQENCAQQLVAGQEWIIYCSYKQINNAKIDWCSRSRMHFANEKEDFYTLTYGNDYDDELKFLRQNLGLHRFLAGVENKTGNRNELPDLRQSILIVVISIFSLILFYYLFNKFFR